MPPPVSVVCCAWHPIADRAGATATVESSPRQELAGKRGKVGLFTPYMMDKKGEEESKVPNFNQGKLRSEYAHLQNGVKVRRGKTWK